MNRRRPKRRRPTKKQNVGGSSKIYFRSSLRPPTAPWCAHLRRATRPSHLGKLLFGGGPLPRARSAFPQRSRAHATFWGVSLRCRRTRHVGAPSSRRGIRSPQGACLGSRREMRGAPLPRARGAFPQRSRAHATFWGVSLRCRRTRHVGAPVASPRCRHEELLETFAAAWWQRGRRRGQRRGRGRGF